MSAADRLLRSEQVPGIDQPDTKTARRLALVWSVTRMYTLHAPHLSGGISAVLARDLMPVLLALVDVTEAPVELLSRSPAALFLAQLYPPGEDLWTRVRLVDRRAPAGGASHG